MNNALTTINTTLRQLELRYQRDAEAVSLLAVSKQQPASAVIQLAQQGQRAFGENYVQEAVAKIQAVTMPGLVWHYIGNLQSNKLKTIAAHFHWVQTVASLRHAEKLNYYSRKNQPLNLCLQVNVSGESQKGGVAMADAMALAQAVAVLPNVRLRGLMAIGAKVADTAQQRAQFAPLQSLFATLAAMFPSVDTLSLGMSGDLEAAVAEGSTMVRVGTLLFGERG